MRQTEGSKFRTKILEIEQVMLYVREIKLVNGSDNKASNNILLEDIKLNTIVTIVQKAITKEVSNLPSPFSLMLSQTSSRKGYYGACVDTGALQNVCRYDQFHAYFNVMEKRLTLLSRNAEF